MTIENWKEELEQQLAAFQFDSKKSSRQMKAFIESLLAAQRKEFMRLISTHTEHNGAYCDTGEDMEWACRSECIELALKRIQSHPQSL